MIEDQTADKSHSCWPPEIPSPAVYAMVLRVLREAGFWESSDPYVMQRLVDPPLTSLDISCVPQGVAGVLPLLHKNYERTYGTISMAHTFDLFEAASAVLDASVAWDDRSCWLAAASLCSHPAVPTDVLSRMKEIAGDDIWLRIRFDQNADPQTYEERRLYAQCWPGIRTAEREYPAAPVVVTDCLLDPAVSWRLAVRVQHSRARVRRLVPETEVPFWFGAETILVCLPETSQRVREAYPDFPERQIITDTLPSDNDGLVEVLHHINTLLPDKPKLHIYDDYELPSR